MTRIFTHRGLDLSAKENTFTESSLEAFLDHLKRGFSLEVDLNFTKDGIVFCHDATLERISKGKHIQRLNDLTVEEACAIKLPHGRLASLEELMLALKHHPSQMTALHFKGGDQDYHRCDILINHLKPFIDLFPQILIFDLTINTAAYLKLRLPQLNLAASVAHPFDIDRFQSAAKGTLISLEKLLAHPHLFSWAWLDEWDLADKKNDGTIDPKGKKLYTPTLFDILHKGGFKTALVTPELHNTSPGLLAEEKHPDAWTQERLFKRIQEILALHPHAVCTDYPDAVKALTGATTLKAFT